MSALTHRAVIRGLTVLQPYATAIATADPRELGPDVGKVIENRGWEPWRSVVGTHIAIHAGKAPFEQSDALTIARSLYGQDASQSILRTWFARLTAGYGHILCVAKVAGVVRVPSDPKLRPSQRRWLIRGQFGWLLEDVRALSVPILFRGAQGLWQVPPDTEKQIRAQVNL